MIAYKLLSIILFTILNILLAKYDSKRIGKGLPIKHWMNGGIYAVLVIAAYFIFKDFFVVGALLLNRLIVFNIALSLYRKLPWDYMPMKPKSIIDKLANKVFDRNGKLMYITYIIFFILMIFNIITVNS